MKRYAHCIPEQALYALGVSMCEREDGAYVLHSDHLADKAADAARIAALEAQVARLEADAGMLDWTIANEGSFHISGSPERGYRICDVRNGLTFATEKHSTARAAITAAMGKEKQGE